MILFINACVRPESRTLALARRTAEYIKGEYEFVDLYNEDIKPLDNERLSFREECSLKGDFTDSMFRYAEQFSRADEIIIAAPFWDLSFPSVLKCYTEAICVNGITFRYSEEGIPEGLCRARRLIYVTTAGGYIPEDNCGFNYIKQLCEGFFGIDASVMIKAEGLDIYGADIDGILSAAEKEAASALNSTGR